MSSIISFRGPQCFIGELSKSRKTRREIKLKISLAFEMLGLNLQSFVLEGIFFFAASVTHVHFKLEKCYVIFLPEYSIDSMSLKGGGGLRERKKEKEKGTESSL